MLDDGAHEYSSSNRKFHDAEYWDTVLGDFEAVVDLPFTVRPLTLAATKAATTTQVVKSPLTQPTSDLCSKPHPRIPQRKRHPPFLLKFIHLHSDPHALLRYAKKHPPQPHSDAPRASALPTLQLLTRLIDTAFFADPTDARVIRHSCVVQRGCVMTALAETPPLYGPFHKRAVLYCNAAVLGDWESWEVLSEFLEVPVLEMDGVPFPRLETPRKRSWISRAIVFLQLRAAKSVYEPRVYDFVRLRSEERMGLTYDYGYPVGAWALLRMYTWGCAEWRVGHRFELWVVLVAVGAVVTNVVLRFWLW